MVEDGQEAILDVTVKRHSKRKAGFEVEKRDDGHYYITKVPDGFSKIGVGDRVVEINGTTHLDFKTAKRANDLIDSFRLEVIPIDDDEDESEDDGEAYEEVDRNRARGGSSATAAAAAAAVSGSLRGGGYGKNGNGMVGGEEDNEEEDEYDEDEDDDEPIDEETRRSREAARANARKRNASSKGGGSEEDWDRPYYAKYQPNDRLMITATKEDPCDDPGITLVEYQAKWKTEIYVAEVERGPFYKTALYRGDKILSVNGKKHPKELKTAAQAQELLDSKLKATVFVMRPDPEKDPGYQWVMANT